MKKLISIALSLVMLCAAFVFPSNALEFANPEFEEFYNLVVWDNNYHDDCIIVCIDLIIRNEEEPFTHISARNFRSLKLPKSSF